MLERSDLTEVSPLLGRDGDDVNWVERSMEGIVNSMISCQYEHELTRTVETRKIETVLAIEKQYDRDRLRQNPLKTVSNFGVSMVIGEQTTRLGVTVSGKCFGN